jgi:phosphate transport system regulatory protein PhoU
MATHLEASLQRDIDHIRDQLTEMGALAKQALEDCVKALVNGDRQLAYAVILRDQYVDEKEKVIDRLCLEFLVRQHPVAGTLRFVYSTIRINLELERVGDYAESIARQVLKLSKLPVEIPKEWLVEISGHSIAMLDNAMKAFVTQDAELALKAIEVEEKVDLLKSKLIMGIAGLYRDNKIPFESLDPLIMIVRRLERVADQAREICIETLYTCTGEYLRHPGADVFRVLFVDETDSCGAIIAEAIASACNEPRFMFASAGIDPQPITPQTTAFLREKGHDTSQLAPRSIHQVPNLEHYQLIVALSPAVKKHFPRRPGKGIYLEWTVEDPEKIPGTPEQVHAACETAYRSLRESILELVQAVLKH